MKPFKQYEKAIYGLLKVIIALFIMVNISACSGSFFIIPVRSAIKYTKDDLKDAYWEYKDELNEVAEIVLGCDAFRQRIISNYEDDESIQTDYKMNDFSEEDWEKIVDLFIKIRPRMIVRSLRKNDDVFYIDFASRKEKGNYIGASLYYFINAETARAYEEYMWVGSLEHLDGFWYIGELSY